MYQWQSYEMRYLGKNNFLLAWSNRKPTEVQKFQLNDVSLRKSGIDTDRTCKFLHNSNTEGLVFKIVWGFFDIVICCFAIFQSSLLIKILLISQKRNSFTQIFYSLISWEYFDQIPGQFVKFSCLINFFKEGTFAEKRDSFLHPKF